MKKINLLLIAATLILGLTSCGLAGIDLSDTDSVGDFKIIVDGTTYKGKIVENFALLDIRTISAEDEDGEFSFACVIDDSDFKKGEVLDVTDQDHLISMTIDGGEDEINYWVTSGTISVISTSKIELDLVMTESYGETTAKVTGYISSK